MQPNEVRDWWTRVRPTFQDLLPHVVAQINNEAARLDKLLARSDETVLCFLGQSGIGKSTLINAIVADGKSVLPAGGTGPMTAIATKVRFSDQKYFRVRYQSPAKLRGLLLNVEAELARRGETVAKAADLDEQAQIWLLPEVAGNDAEEADSGAAKADVAPSERMEIMFRAAQTLVDGSTTGPIDLPGLAMRLRAALGLEYTGSIDESDRERLRDIAEALNFARINSTRRVSEYDVGDKFAALLQKHTAGSLAPLVAEIDVGWPSPALAGGVVLVDLPGVGIAGDDYQKATEEYVRKRARGVIIVVRRGISRDEIELIRTSGLWDRILLAAGDTEADPCDVIAVRTSMDEVVANEIADADMDDETVSATYRRIVSEAEENVRNQTGRELGRLTGIETDDSDLRQARERAACDVLERLAVHAVSATDYTRLVGRIRRPSPVATDTAETGIPALRERLVELGQRNRAALQSLRTNSAVRIQNIANAALDQELAYLAEGKREKEELERLKIELARFLEPFRTEYANRQGQFREFLDGTAAALIEKLVARAQADARKSVVRYLAELATAPWATLKAAVVRGGSFVGSRKIDLPDDIAQLFQEPVAAIWGSKTGLLRDVRSRTSEFGDITHAMVNQILDWAEAWPGSVVSPEALEATRRSATALSEQLGQVGQDAADDLRRAVRDRLLEATKPVIQRACRDFVDRGEAAGRGVKQRMVSLCADLAADSMERAGTVAGRLLNERFAEVRTDISVVFAQWGDPIDRTANAIAPAEYVGDPSKRAALIERLEKLRLTADEQSKSELASV